uniref:Uncharacterized protein n=1 Tax=Mesocestoides corti TaxID=53468 RepID=A0A5K3FSE2_MESCO
MACAEDKQPTREGRNRGAVYNERRGQLGRLGWRAPDVWLWLLIGQYSLFCCTSLLPIRARVFYTSASMDTLDIDMWTITAK